MAVIAELTTLYRAVEELSSVLGRVRDRYGDVPAVRRLLNDLDRITLDAAELDELTPLPNGSGAGAAALSSQAPSGAPLAAGSASVGPVHLLDDTPHDPSLWVGADDEGLGGYHR